MKSPGKFTRILLLSFLGAAVLLSAVLGTKLYRNSEAIKACKKDFFTVNKIKYGLLNGESWSWQVEQVIEVQIDTFNFSERNKQVMREQIGIMLNRLLNEIQGTLEEKSEKPVENFKNKVIMTFVDMDKFREKIPSYSNALIEELDKAKNRDKVKKLLKEKVSHLLCQGKPLLIAEQQEIFDKYHVDGLRAFNNYIRIHTQHIEQEQRRLGYMLVGVLALTLLAWIYILRKRIRPIYPFAFLLAVSASFITLFIGISLPMIEIDARISRVDLEILSSHIVFYDQVIFYQSKSILDVVIILMKNGKGDAVFVGSLILLFSVLFPIMKLVSATIYLFKRNKESRFINFLAFHSGKWSMADVMVVAIFMAYIGFQSILNDQLAKVNIQEERFNLFSTNKSNLQIGFIIFVSFCLFNLFLSVILKRITQTGKR